MSTPCRIAVYVLTALILYALPACGPSVSAPDNARPQRICSVNVTADEMLADLVSPSRVVGITTYSDDHHTSNILGHYPESIARIGKAELEPIVALAPDLLVTSPFHTADFKEIAGRSGLRLCKIRMVKSGQDIVAEYRRLGRAVGETEKAEDVIEKLESRVQALERRISARKERPRVLHISGDDFTVGRTTLIHEIIERAGGRNVGAEMGLEGWAQFEAESVVVADPDFVMVSEWPQDKPRDFGSLKVLPAIAEGRVVAMPGRLLNTTSRHWIEAAEVLAKTLHPSAFIDDE